VKTQPFTKKLVPLAGLAGLGALMAPAAQAAVDVSGLVTEIASQSAPIAAVGGAILAIIVAVKVFNWIRSAIR